MLAICLSEVVLHQDFTPISMDVVAIEGYLPQFHVIFESL